MLIVLAAALLAQDPPPPPAPPEPPRFAWSSGQGVGGLDRDGDGQITREEFTAPMGEAFARMDRDGDGVVSTEELTGGHRFEVRTETDDDGERRIERSVVVIGPDGERREIDLAEGPGRMRLFRDGPGERRIEFRRRGDSDAKDGEVSVLSFGRPGQALAFAGRDRADMDKDGDGRVSEDEFTAGVREAFGRIDADGSGYLEEGERGRGGVHVFTRRIGDED